MSRHNARLGTIQIANGQQNSTTVASISSNTRLAFGSAVDFIIYSPAALTGTVTVQVSPIEGPAAGDWKNLTISGTVVTIPAGAAVLIPAVAMFDLRLSSNLAEGANRDFILVVQYDT